MSDNKQILEDAFAGLAAGKRRALLDILADDVEWKVMGTTKLSKTYRGKQALIDEVLAPMAAALAEQVALTPERYLGEGDCVVVEASGRALTKTGVRYDNRYCWIYRFQDGKVVAVTEYLDTELVTAAFGR
jgi:hypothetical protein